MVLMNENPDFIEKSDEFDKKLAKIASENIPELEGRKTLKSQWSDHLDFFETSVWSLEAALKAAYELGKNEGR